MTDKEIVQKLIERDNRVTQAFFFKHCKPLFQSIIRKLFDYPVDYNEFVNELYIHLMANDAQKLRSFKFGSSIYGWLRQVAFYYYLDKKNHGKMIENESKEPLILKEECPMTPKLAINSCEDLKRLLAAMPCERYVYVINKLFIEDMPKKDLANEMGITLANLYNIKKRAILQLTQVALNDIKNYKE